MKKNEIIKHLNGLVKEFKDFPEEQAALRGALLLLKSGDDDIISGLQKARDHCLGKFCSECEFDCGEKCLLMQITRSHQTPQFWRTDLKKEDFS